MAISRFRLRLAAWFSAVFLVGLLVLDLGFLVYSRRKAEAKVSQDVRLAAASLDDAFRDEHAHRPDAPADSLVREVLDEWPAGPDAILILDSTGRQLGARGDSSRISALVQVSLPAKREGTVDLTGSPRNQLRAAWIRNRQGTGLTVIVANSTFRTHEDQEALVGWLLLSMPLIGLGATVAGYLLARRALKPVESMAEALDAIDPGRIDRRLPTSTPPDELDHLASHFNALLDRLVNARETNRRFVAQAAHQLRTPLTIVRGEAALGLDRPRTTEDYRAALRRINLSAEQMSRRVNELFLLAEAEVGERPELTDRVELDGMVMEAADLMRGRATSLDRTLEFGGMDDVVVLGAESLLREAVMEVLENALRHGTAAQPVRIAVQRNSAGAHVQITNSGPSFPEGPSNGLGLPIVRWVAEIHGGSVRIERLGEVNAVVLDLPATISSTS